MRPVLTDQNLVGAQAVYRADELKLTLETGKKAYQQGDEIRLILTVENTSQKIQRVVRYSAPGYSYWIKATDESGRQVGSHVFTGLEGREAIMLPGNSARVLAPSQKVREEVDLDTLLKLPGPGRYRLRAWRFPLMFTRIGLETLLREGRPLNFENSLEWHRWLGTGIESNETEVEILPHSPTQ